MVCFNEAKEVLFSQELRLKAQFKNSTFNVLNRRQRHHLFSITLYYFETDHYCIHCPSLSQCLEHFVRQNEIISSIF